MTKKQEQTEEDPALQDGEKPMLTSAAGRGEARKAQQCHSAIPGDGQSIPSDPEQSSSTKGTGNSAEENGATERARDPVFLEQVK